jgi:Tol biopolymer transport system component
MICSNLQFQSAISACLPRLVRRRLKNRFLTALFLLLPIVPLLLPHPGGAQEETGVNAPRIVRVLEKPPEHSGFLYDNSDWSHDGKKIAFMVHDLDAKNTSTIWVYHIVTDRLIQVTYADTVGMLDVMPKWSPDNTQITFSSSRGNSLNIFVVDEDGNNLRKITADMSLDSLMFGKLWDVRPDWTPDGENLIYANEVDGNWDIYRTNLADGTIVRLTDDPARDLFPHSSPDGKYISFLSHREEGRKLWLLNTMSGELEAMKAFDGESSIILGGSNVHDWSPDGEWIVTEHWPKGFGWRTQCVIISVRTGKVFPVPVPVVDQESYATWSPSWSSDGRRVLYAAMPLQRFNSDLVVLDLTTEENYTLRDSLIQVGQLAWSPDNTQIAFFSVQPGTEEGAGLDTLITLVNSQPDSNQSTTFAGKNPDWSPDGSQIACVTTGHNGGVLALYDISANETTFLKAGHSGERREPRFSPDGELLAYVTQEGENQDLWMYDLITEDHVQLTFSGGNKGSITWSPDGESIVFRHNQGGFEDTDDLWIVPAYGGKNRLITPNEMHDRFALWPEGQNNEIYFSSQRDKKWEVWTTDPEGNEKFVFRSTVDAIPVLIRDPAHIYYLKFRGWEERGLSLFAIATGKDRQLTQSTTVAWPQASPDATKIAYAVYERGPWDQGVLWTSYVGDLFPVDELP